MKRLQKKGLTRILVRFSKWLMIGADRNPSIFELHEREARVFPRELLFGTDGNSLVLQETRQLSAVEFRDVAGGVEIRALGVIGYLPLTRDITLNIRPKFPVANLWAMISEADERYERLLPIIRSYGKSESKAPHLLLAKAFAYYLSRIISSGLARSYVREEYRGYFKPRVDFSKTASRLLSRGDEVNTISNCFSFSANLRINGLLKSACLAFLRLLPISPLWAVERSTLLDALNSLQNVRAVAMHPDDLTTADAAPIWVRQLYQGALTTYAVLLGFNNFGFAYESGGNDLPSFLFSLDGIFESFIRNSLRRQLSEKMIVVLDGNIQKHQTPLFIDNRKFPTKPDLIFKKDRQITVLGEVKYKPRIEEADRYQLISHVLANRCSTGLWISPSTGNDAGLEYIGEIASGAKFYHYKIDLSGDVGVGIKGMSQEVLKLLP